MRASGRSIGNPRIGTAELTGLLLPPDETVDSASRPGFSRCWSRIAARQLLPDIAALFEEFKRDAERILKVTLRSATPVAAAQVDAMKAALKKRFGRDIELDQRIDPSVIGGAVIDAGDMVIDGSVRGRLARLESALVN